MEQKNINQEIIVQASALLSVCRDITANMANLSALIYQSVSGLNWAGFYIFKNNKLVLGPFQGKPACVFIDIGRGVCGTAAKEGKTIIVEDVHLFPGHIACDCASKSEIVVPLFTPGAQLLGVMDIDSPILNRFGAAEKELFEALSDLLIKSSDI